MERATAMCFVAFAAVLGAIACSADDAAHEGRDGDAAGGKPAGAGGADASGGAMASGGAYAMGGAKAGSGGAGSGGLSDLPIGELPPGFNEMRPGGDTMCARGTPYRFYVRPGTVNRLLIEFRGGGACWDEETCKPGATNVDGFQFFLDAPDPDIAVLPEAWGIYDHANDENPFKDWHHVYIPYCTGDIHQGNADVTYGDFTVHHRGAVNVRAVLDWTYQAAPNPEQVFVTGCSAGAYASILWAAHVRNHYTKASVMQFADSGMGVTTQPLFQVWKAIESSYPTFIPVDFDGALPQLYRAIGDYFPDMFLSTFSTTYDDAQYYYYTAGGGGDVYEWAEGAKANLVEMAKTPNFRSFRSAGYDHCAIPYPKFYTETSNGVRLIDWLRDITLGKKPDSVSCEPDCGTPNPRDIP